MDIKDETTYYSSFLVRTSKEKAHNTSHAATLDSCIGSKCGDAGDEFSSISKAWYTLINRK